MKNPLQIVAFLALAVFVVLWGWIGFYIQNFEPSKGEQLPVIPVATGILAALFAGGVATSTAAMLGIELRTRLAQSNNKVGTAVSSLSRPVWIGVVTYLVVGVFIGIVWLTHQDIAPAIMSVFALMTVGWLVGILVAALKATSND
ncbi:hypothetical protein BH09ACT4_BH09ACT4_03200 [soil metagenome]